MPYLSILINEETDKYLKHLCASRGLLVGDIVADGLKLYSYLELKVANGYRIQLVHTDSNRRLDVDLP